MFNKLKNFAINKVLRHVAENKALNDATNILALIPIILTALITTNTDWMLMFRCCDAPGSLAEVVRVAGAVALAVLLWLCGKFTWLKQWLPVAEEIIQEAEKQIRDKPPAQAKPVKK